MPPPIRFLPPPYQYALNVDVSEGNWDLPSNVLICEIRVVALTATQYFDLRVRQGESRIVTLRGRGENIWRLEIDRVFQFNTTPEIRQNCIEVYGYFEDAIQQYLGT